MTKSNRGKLTNEGKLGPSNNHKAKEIIAPYACEDCRKDYVGTLTTIINHINNCPAKKDKVPKNASTNIEDVPNEAWMHVDPETGELRGHNDR